MHKIIDAFARIPVTDLIPLKSSVLLSLATMADASFTLQPMFPRRDGNPSPIKTLEKRSNLKVYVSVSELLKFFQSSEWKVNFSCVLKLRNEISFIRVLLKYVRGGLVQSHVGLSYDFNVLFMFSVDNR